jgi:hypothetical protein
MVRRSQRLKKQFQNDEIQPKLDIKQTLNETKVEFVKPTESVVTESTSTESNLTESNLTDSNPPDQTITLYDIIFIMFPYLLLAYLFGFVKIISFKFLLFVTLNYVFIIIKKYGGFEKIRTYFDLLS